MASIQGTNVQAPIVPNDSNDVFASHLSIYGQGGLRTVATLADRDAITLERREWLMEVNVLADGKKYTLKLGKDLADNSLWQEVAGGAAAYEAFDASKSYQAGALVTNDQVLWVANYDYQAGDPLPLRDQFQFTWTPLIGNAYALTKAQPKIANGVLTIETNKDSFAVNLPVQAPAVSEWVAGAQPINSSVTFDGNLYRVKSNIANGQSTPAGNTQYYQLLADGVSVQAAIAALQGSLATQTGRIDTILNGAPAALDTLKEIADQLAADEQGTAAILATQQQHTQQLATKTDKTYVDAADATLSAKIASSTGILFYASQDYFPTASKVDTSKLYYAYDTNTLFYATKTTSTSPGGVTSTYLDYTQANQQNVFQDLNNSYPGAVSQGAVKRALDALSAAAITKAYVDAADARLQAQLTTEKQRMDTLVANAPQALDTLKEISDQLAADEAGVAAILATQQQHTQQLANLPRVHQIYRGAYFDIIQAELIENGQVKPGASVLWSLGDVVSVDVNFQSGRPKGQSSLFKCIQAYSDNDSGIVQRPDTTPAYWELLLGPSTSSPAPGAGSGTLTIIRTSEPFAIEDNGEQYIYLPENADGIISILVSEAAVNGFNAVRPIYPSNFSVGGNRVVISDVANLSSGDEVTVVYFITGSGGGSSSTPSSTLEFVFNAGFADDFSTTIGTNQAGTYATASTSNTDTVQYTVNGTSAGLPLTLSSGDTFQVVITRQQAAQGAVVTLTT